PSYTATSRQRWSNRAKVSQSERRHSIYSQRQLTGADTLRINVHGCHPSGSALRAPAATPESDVHHRFRVVAGAGYRRQYLYFSAHQRGPAKNAARGEATGI